MTFAHLVDWCSIEGRVTKRCAEKILKRAFSTIRREVRFGGRVLVPKFGVFSRRTTKARLMLDPNTREAKPLPASTRLGFRPSKHARWRT